MGKFRVNSWSYERFAEMGKTLGRNKMDVRIVGLMLRCLGCEYCDNTNGICGGCRDGSFFLEKGEHSGEAEKM